jgi:hypothetical protein
VTFARILLIMAVYMVLLAVLCPWARVPVAAYSHIAFTTLSDDEGKPTIADRQLIVSRCDVTMSSCSIRNDGIERNEAQ